MLYLVTVLQWERLGLLLLAHLSGPCPHICTVCHGSCIQDPEGLVSGELCELPRISFLLLGFT